MQVRTTINARGEVTIPAAMLRAFGLKANDEIIVEDVAQGVLLRPVAGIPSETYTEKRIEEFARDDKAIGKHLRRRT